MRNLIVIGIEGEERIDIVALALAFGADALPFSRAANPSTRLSLGGGKCGFSKRLSAMPQYAMAQSGSACSVSSNISFAGRYQN
jgi:hypothetical protein